MTLGRDAERVHIVGIGGAHMSAIAQILHAWGRQVSGSDQRESELTEQLRRRGIPVAIGHAAANLGDAHLVVTTSAAQSDNPELLEATRRRVPIVKRDQMVAWLMEGRYSIAVAGTHGKTTTSGLIAHMLVEAGLDPTYLIGGAVRSLGGNAAPGEGRYIVVEADEYDRAFLSYHPDVAVVTNIEPDHLDIYGTEASLTAAFAQFLGQASSQGHVITCADSPRLQQAANMAAIGAQRQSYALDAPADWTASDVVAGEAGQSFSALRDGHTFGVFTITLPGRHNVSNALAGIATGSTIGLDAGVMQSALASYRGAQRRFEYVGEAAGVTVMDDYAHHPTEVREGVVRPARQRFGPRRLVVLFQPHTYTRTQYLLEEWKTCFSGIDVLFIAPTYAAREAADRGLSGEDLAGAIESPAATYCATLDEAAERVAGELRPGDVFFTVGAGDVDTVGPKVLGRLRRTGG